MLKIQEGVAMWKVCNSNFKVSFGSERKYLGKEMLVQKRSLHLSDAEKITEIKSNVNLQFHKFTNLVMFRLNSTL